MWECNVYLHKENDTVILDNTQALTNDKTWKTPEYANSKATKHSQALWSGQTNSTNMVTVMG